MKGTKIKIAAGCAAVFAAVSLASCGSTKVEAKTANVDISNVQRPTPIDWKGASVGAQFPEWLEPALNDDIDGLPSNMKNQLEGKYYVIINTSRVRRDQNSTKDLKMAQELAAASYMQNIARSLNSAVDTRFHGILSEREEAQSSSLATAAAARFTGFSRVADSWVLGRRKDADTGKITDTYEVVQIYACEQSLWESQAAIYIRSLGANLESEAMQKVEEQADDLAATIKPGTIRASE